jgi:hypothetical protein
MIRASGMALAALGGLAAAVFAFANIGQYLSGSVAQAILTLLAALIGALPGLILWWLNSRRR